MSLANLRRLFHTVRYLRPGQVLGRVAFRLRPVRLDHRPAPACRPAVAPWPANAWRSPSMLGPNSFRFLNETHSITSAADWNNPDWDKLWLYNLHYFDDLTSTHRDQRLDWQRAWVARWIAENPASTGNGWEPYPLSLRIVNWIKWSLSGNTLAPDWSDSLAQQLRVLAQRLEWHLLGNHLLANAKALVFGGLYFSGPEAERWLTTGLRILAKQLPEQVLEDGGHFERSPMYHAIILEDLLGLVSLAQCYGVDDQGALTGDLAQGYESWCESIPGMLSWLRAMTHPDGEIGFFNDAAFGIAPRWNQLESHAAQLGLSGSADDSEVDQEIRKWLLMPSGYVRLASGPVVCLLDVAPVGPDYLPGHAHADTLSFELSAFGQRVIVNGGTSCYGTGPQRLAERGTAAHNTVQIDGQDSSEVWGGFRVARRARPTGLNVTEEGDRVAVECAHDGYRRLPGRPIHERRWRLSPGRLEIVDTLEGGFGSAVSRFHLHPDVRVEGRGDHGYLVLKDGKRVMWEVVEGGAEVVESDWHPAFGLSLPSHCLAVGFGGPVVRTRLTWS